LCFCSGEFYEVNYPRNYGISEYSGSEERVWEDDFFDFHVSKSEKQGNLSAIHI